MLSLLAVGFYKFAPAPGEDAGLTRWLASTATPREVWEYRNAKHLALVQRASADTLLTTDARRPPVHRYRYPQYVRELRFQSRLTRLCRIFEQKSPHLVPVGGDVDLTGLVVKRE